MAVSEYCTNSDLVKYRPNILSLGVADWANQIIEAGKIIDRVLESRWYRHEATERGINFRDTQFDRSLLIDVSTQLRRLAVYKTLELIYIYQAKDVSEPDGFHRNAKDFRDLYIDELSEVLSVGLNYDWDASGAIGWTERYSTAPRRLYRA